jgi:hypothetical protein
LTLLRDDLLRADLRRVHEIVHEAFLVLFRDIKATSSEALIPVLALRGGLLAYHAAASVLGGPLGLIAPRGKGRYEHRAYGDVPVGNQYLIIDTIANTGETLVDCIRCLGSHLPGAKVRVAFLFGTTEACGKVEQFAPGGLDVMWDDFQRGSGGRLIGINYDAGDYALMDALGDRVMW